MKKFLALLLSVLMVLTLAACGSKEETPTTGSDNELAGTYDITLWVSESEGVADLTKTQVERFVSENPGIVINATIEPVSESNSATNMITSVEDGADIYCFAQDQLARLVMAGALSPLGEGAAKTVKENNDAGSVGAASVAGQLYCYPLTSDNGYFMFYDKSVVAEDHIDDLASIIADCEAAGKMFSMELETSAWYNAAFFFGTGCVSEWTTNLEGEFTSVNDTFNSEAGVKALKGMQIILKSSAYNSSSDTSEFSAAIPSAVVVSGVWGANTAQAALGDNYACADLPSFTVDGETFHIGSFSGNKLMGVKPQTDPKKAAVCQQLAAYLTGEECQIERFELVGWGPSNKNAQQMDAVKANPALSALAAQSDYAIPQGNIHGSWWDIAKVYCTSAKEATTDEELVAALQTYADTINALFSMSEEQKNAFSVIGALVETNWDVDFPMEKVDENTYVSETLELKAGDEFKVRQGASWDVNYGADGSLNGPNVVVEKDVTAKIQLVVSEDGTTGTITIVE